MATLTAPILMLALAFVLGPQSGPELGLADQGHLLADPVVLGGRSLDRLGHLEIRHGGAPRCGTGRTRTPENEG